MVRTAKEPIRVVFMGTPEFAVPSLAALRERHEIFDVAAVFSQPDRPAGRGRRVQPSPVSQYAAAHQIPVYTPTRLKAAETQTLLASVRPTVCVVAAYGRILPPALLTTAEAGCVNVHASLLPRHRGASPIAHAITSGDSETGVSIMRMEEGLDTGPVFSQRTVPITLEDTCGTLTETLAEVGAQLLVETLPQIVAGTLTPQQQDDAASTYAPLLKKEDGWLHFERPALDLTRIVRGFTPWPGATTDKGGQRVQVLRAHADENESAATAARGMPTPGEVLSADGRGVRVACGEGILCLDEVKPAGKRAMPASAWVAGRGVAAGDRFTTPGA